LVVNESTGNPKIDRERKKKALARYYNLQSILGNDWAIFYCIIGGRKTGKSYSVSDFLIK